MRSRVAARGGFIITGGDALMGFTKLDDNLAGSSLLAQGGLVLTGFWAVLLSLKGREGRVYESPAMLAKRCTSAKFPITTAMVWEMLETLAAPDPESRTPDNEGRRIIIERSPRFCIVILNHQRYLERDETAAERARRYRERHGASRVTGVTNGVPSLSPSTSTTEGVSGEPSRSDELSEVEACEKTCREYMALSGRPLDEVLWEFSEFKGRRLVRLETAPHNWLRVTHDRIKAALMSLRAERSRPNVAPWERAE